MLRSLANANCEYAREDTHTIYHIYVFIYIYIIYLNKYLQIFTLYKCCFKESLSSEYHMYQVIPLHSCDYLNRLLIKINMATDEDKMKSDPEQIDEIGVAVQSWP